MPYDQCINKICVYGIGGVGGYFGSKIASAINANTVTNYQSYFIARGVQLEAIQRNGITVVSVVSPEQTIIGRPTMATDDVNEIPDPDLYLICVKSYDLDGAVKSIRPKINNRTIIVPLLNGADIYERIRMNLSNGIVLPACVYVGVHIQKPGVIGHGGGEGQILLGKDPRHPDFYPHNVLRTFDDLGVNYQWHDNPFPAIWSKFIFIASFGLITAHTGKSLGEVMADGAAKKIVREIMQEIYNIAKGKGVKLPSDIIEESLQKADNFPYDTKTSYQRDVESKGSMNEGDLFGGTILKEGKALGIPTPVTSSVYTEIQNRLMG